MKKRGFVIVEFVFEIIVGVLVFSALLSAGTQWGKGDIIKKQNIAKEYMDQKTTCSKIMKEIDKIEMVLQAHIYENEDLITLCEDCHESVHLSEKSKNGISFFITSCLSYTDWWLIEKIMIETFLNMKL